MKFLYWFSTALFGFAMGMSGVGHLAGLPRLVSILQHLGYPEYVRYILGALKVIGAMVISIPASARLKEWSYAGFFFLLTGAITSHLFSGDALGDLVKPLILLALLGVSYFAYQRIDLPGKKPLQNKPN